MSRRTPHLPTVEPQTTVDETASATEENAGKKPRTIVNRTADRVPAWLQIEAIFDDPTYWQFAAEIPEQSVEGRRRKLPTIFYVAMPALAAVFRSFDNVEVELSDGDSWRRLCRIICRYQTKYAPDQERFHERKLAATKPITAQNFRDARKTWLADYWHLLRGIFKTNAATTARSLGYLDPDGPGSINNLCRERIVVGDGKVSREYGAVYRPLTDAERNRHSIKGEMSHVVDKRTGKILPASVLDGANIYKDGAGRITIGYKTVRIAVRDNQHSNSTVILDVATEENKNEAQTAVDMLLEAKQTLPGMLAAVYDGAMHGMHIAQLARYGIVTTSPVSAESNPDKKDRNKRVEKTGALGSQSHESPVGTCVHEFAYKGGQVYEVHTDAAGNKTFDSLGDPRLELRGNRPGHYRLYTVFTMTCHRAAAFGGAPVTADVRFNISNDPADGINIAENVRAHPPCGKKYAETYNYRQTIENDNHQSDLRKFQSRSRAKTPEHNLINEIGFSIAINAVARVQARRRSEAPPGLAA